MYIVTKIPEYWIFLSISRYHAKIGTRAASLHQRQCVEIQFVKVQCICIIQHAASILHL